MMKNKNDKYCPLCGEKCIKLEKHHFIPRRLFEEFNQINPHICFFLESFFISICQKCHKKIHPENEWHFKVNEEITKKNVSIEFFKSQIKNKDEYITQLHKELFDKKKSNNSLLGQLKKKDDYILILKERIKKNKGYLDEEKENKKTLKNDLIKANKIIKNIKSKNTNNENKESKELEKLNEEIEKKNTLIDSLLEKNYLNEEEIKSLKQKYEKYKDVDIFNLGG